MISRIDIEIALYNGTATQFQVDDLPGDILSQLCRDPPFRSDKKNIEFITCLSPDLQEILSDIMTLTHHLDNHAPTTLNVYAFQEAIIQVSYRLIHISPLSGPRPTHSLQDMLHLALTAFTTTLFLGFGPAHLKAPLLPALLRESAQRYQPVDTESRLIRELFLWVLLLGRASVFTDLDGTWLVPMVREIAFSLRLRTWEDVRCVLSNFPWVERVHSQASKALWDKIILQ